MAAAPGAGMWAPDIYEAFHDERARPASDLIARIDAERPSIVYDLGCGTGDLARRLARRWPMARVSGVDASEAMLATARSRGGPVTWVRADLAHWQPEAPADVIVSNAALHWLGDHQALFERLLGALRPGGSLAVQMPGNFAAPTHTLLEETVRDGPWRPLLEPQLRPAPVAAATTYIAWLGPYTAALDVWETTYYHRLTGSDAVLRWVQGSLLRPLLGLLDDGTGAAFLKAYGARLAAAYPQQPDGITVLPFRRLFLIARRRSEPQSGAPEIL